MARSDDKIPPPPPPQTPTQQAPYTVSTIKLHILKKGNGPVQVSTDTNEKIKVLPPKTAEEIVARERERKTKTILLMAILEDHLAKFHKMTDAKEMWKAIKSRFGGNDELKKMHKYILKQQFKNFSVSNSEGFHKGYDRFQSLLGQIEIHSVGVSTEDANQKFLRSLPASCSPQLDHEDLEQLDEFDLEEIDLKWQVAMNSIRLKKFYKKTGRKLQFDAKEPVGFDKTKVECFKCHKIWHFTRECRSKGNQDIRRRDAWNTGNKAKDNNGTLGIKQKTIGGDLENRRNLKLWSSDIEDSPVNDRYAEGMHAVPPPMTEIYMPSRSDFGIDDSMFTYGPKQFKTSESDAETSNSASYESNSSVETLESVPKPVVNETKAVIEPKVWSDAPIIEEYELDSDDEHVIIPSKEQETPSFTFVNTLKHVKTPRQTVKEQNICSQNPKPKKRDWNGLMSKTLGLGYGFTKKACFVCGSFSHLIRDCDFHEKRMAKQVELNKQKSKSTSLRENKAVWNNVQRLNQQNKFVPTTDDPQKALKNKGIVDSGCSRHMTGNKAYLVDYHDYKGGHVAFGGSKGHITSKGQIRIGKLDFEDVCFVKELQHFNLFSVSQMCDKKNKVLFTNTECLVLSSDFKLHDENQVLLRVPRQNNMYSFNLENIVPTGGLAYLIAKATVDESNKWHRRLIHVNFKNLNKLVKGNLVRGLPSKIFQNDHTCVACQKGKRHKASFNTACYVLNKVLVTKPQNKTPYELITGKIPLISYIRPFRCHVTILNTIDHQGKFDGKYDEGFLVGYSLNSKAFRPVRSENQANKIAGPKEANHSAGTQDNIITSYSEKEAELLKNTVYYHYSLLILQLSRAQKQRIELRQTRAARASSTNTVNIVSTPVSTASPSRVFSAGESSYPDLTIYADQDDSQIPALRIYMTIQEKLLQFKIQKVWILVDFPYGKKAIRTKWVYKNKKDERGVVVRNKARIRAIKIFFAFVSFMGFIVYQMDVKSAFLYGTIDEEVYVTQPPSFIDPKYPNKVYKVVKALYGLHQSPRAWYATLSTFLLKNGYKRGTIDKTLFIKKEKKDIMLVKQKEDGIFISQDKYVAEILKKFDFMTVKIASNPIETQKPLIKDKEAADVDVHLYRSMIGSLMYLTASRLDIMFAVYACSRFQVTPKTSHLQAVKRVFRYLKGKPKLVLWYPSVSSFDLEAYFDSDYAGANLDRKSTAGEAEYGVVANCYGKVLWIQNQILGKKMQFGLVLEALNEFVAQHNMVACLEKIERNSEFHEIVDVLTSSMIHHALTQIHATVDSKAVVTEASIRSSLLFNDANGAPTEPQPTPSPTHPSTGDQLLVTESSSSHDTTQDSRDSLKGTNRSEEIRFSHPMIVLFQLVTHLTELRGRKKDKPEPTLDDSTFDGLDADLDVDVDADLDDDHGMNYMDTKEPVNEGRLSEETEELKLTIDTEEIVQDKGSGKKRGSTEELVSTTRPEDVGTVRTDVGTADPIAPLITTTSIFDDEGITMA
uniref:Putative ribonuclease H-like domain-containing protein n=1 Tax=Tanacetum cinerariifolium TaxID=118510 RepID=A0A6L2JL09_TANCI|nr:putative ribonuclease H-like domain-containing protein [Tanacetum cinerariifolium]